ncbi:hypothetical protein BJX66DRAFT_318869 [Aspergillus keveii]|uniref:HNH nuclease domain-containing protein n=1 Tax=Aspergillus keveii TaxID=714993 RepID=A0ABR4FJP8_9EURO
MEALVAAHIYPVSRLDDWIKDECERWVETEDGVDEGVSAADVAPKGMFSVKNGLLLSVAVHDAFCNFSFGADVDVSDPVSFCNYTNRIPLYSMDTAPYASPRTRQA